MDFGMLLAVAWGTLGGLGCGNPRGMRQRWLVPAGMVFCLWLVYRLAAAGAFGPTWKPAI